MNLKCLNQKGLMSYPEAVRQLPFANWRYEQVKGRQTKVPYNPVSGAKASSSRIETMTTLERALAAVDQYDGVLVKVSGNVGFIDIDDCVQDDGSLDERALKILEMLPDALVEYSPSGKGLHMIFFVPEGFAFDRDDYFVNNKEVHVENYFPGFNNQLMTMTGNVYREGSMRVSLEQLMLFEETFMKRPEPVITSSVPVPEGGTILTDEEVFLKASQSATGQKFVDYYNGEWEKYGGDNPNWSQSEADLGFCAMLAFYCRGDKEQIDRIFRESGLYRDKWDRHQAGTTYGEMTMRRAIAGCKAFYEKGYRSDAAEDFDDEAEQIRQAIDAALETDLDIDTVFSPDFIANAAWASANDMARFTKIKQKLPREVSVRDFLREVKKLSNESAAEDAARQKDKVSFLSLSGVTAPKMLVPGNWIVSDGGIRHWEMVMGVMTPVRVTSEPLYISAKLVNVDDGTEKLETTFRRNSHYKTLIAPRADMLNRNNIIKYADEGFPVSSGNAASLTQYIEEMEAINGKTIPIRRSIRRAGWIGDEFYPYSLKGGIVAQTDGNETERILAALKTEGSEQIWLDAAVKLRRMPFARAMLAASFAAPLLEKLQHRIIYFHIWYGSRSGKTAALKFVIAVWGDPRVLVSKYFSTIVGMERWAGTLKHLPFALDELQTLNQKRLSVNDVVYTLGNGVGKTRGRVGSGLQKVETWRNTILSTGEQPMSTDSSMDGVNTRLMEIYACPLNENGIGEADEELARELHQVSECNYGFAGEKFIRWLAGRLDSLKEDYERIRSAISNDNVQRDNVAVLALADYYSSMAVFHLPEEHAFKEAVELAGKLLKNLEDNAPKDSIESAWEFICGWVASNKARFSGGSVLHEVTPVYGKIENGKVYAIAKNMNDALEEAGFSARKCIKGFQERGLIETFRDSQGKERSQIGKSVKGIVNRVYSLNLTITSEAADDFPDAVPPLTADMPDFLR